VREWLMLMRKTSTPRHETSRSTISGAKQIGGPIAQRSFDPPVNVSFFCFSLTGDRVRRMVHSFASPYLLRKSVRLYPRFGQSSNSSILLPLSLMAKDFFCRTHLVLAAPFAAAIVSRRRVRIRSGSAMRLQKGFRMCLRGDIPQPSVAQPVGPGSDRDADPARCSRCRVSSLRARRTLERAEASKKNNVPRNCAQGVAE